MFYELNDLPEILSIENVRFSIECLYCTSTGAPHFL